MSPYKGYPKKMVYVNEEAWKKLKSEAALQGVFIGDLVNKILEEYYERGGSEENRSKRGIVTETSRPNISETAKPDAKPNTENRKIIIDLII